MNRVAAPLAAALLALGLAACGGDGAEPGAPKGATLVLDFQPNAVHSGIYTAQAAGSFRAEGLNLTIRQPSSSADSAKLLEAGRADLGVMDINDFGIARQRGLDLVAIAAIVQRPLASVIARDSEKVHTPADLTGKTVGVTGVPSDDAVLDTVLSAGGAPPGSVKRVTIGFKAVPALASGRIDAATVFWNAEGVALKEQGLPTREFRVDEFGAPRYPELIVATTRELAESALAGSGNGLPCQFLKGLTPGYGALSGDPDQALDALLEAVPDLDRDSQGAQLDALAEADAFSPSEGEGPSPAIDGRALDWLRWAASRGLVGREGIKTIAVGLRPGIRLDCGAGRG